ncbi:MAG TPA: metal-dependent hydrolase, partial [Longimicrobiales bacterium]|nr:metal-dependent hydrolase [Longimicrobiales bacterium]
MWGILVGVGLLDLLFGPFVLVGLERASVTPDVPPGFTLDHIDWSHSLLMSLVWSALYAACFLRSGGRVAGVMAVAAFSHFVLDLPMHPPDLALWPGSGTHLGFGLWRALPRGWWFVELALVLAGCAYYVGKARGSRAFGGRAALVAAVVVLLHVF